MSEKNKWIEESDIKIAVGILLGLMLYTCIPALGTCSVNAAALATVIFCCLDNVAVSFKSACTRLSAVIIGAAAGSAVVAADQFIQNTACFILLGAAGIVGVFFICRRLKIPYMQAKIGCIVYVLVLVVLQGSFRIVYGGMFALGTLAGAAVSVVVSWVWGLLGKRKS